LGKTNGQRGSRHVLLVLGCFVTRFRASKTARTRSGARERKCSVNCPTIQIARGDRECQAFRRIREVADDPGLLTCTAALAVPVPSLQLLSLTLLLAPAFAAAVFAWISVGYRDVCGVFGFSAVSRIQFTAIHAGSNSSKTLVGLSAP
jgi:hypothetical protein